MATDNDDRSDAAPPANVATATAEATSTTDAPSTSTTTTTRPPDPSVTLAFGGDVHFEGVLRGKVAADPTTLFAPHRAGPAGGRPRNGQPRVRDHRGRRTANQAVHVPRFSGRVHGVAVGRHRRRHNGEQPRPRLRTGGPRATRSRRSPPAAFLWSASVPTNSMRTRRIARVSRGFASPCRCLSGHRRSIIATWTRARPRLASRRPSASTVSCVQCRTRPRQRRRRRVLALGPGRFGVCDARAAAARPSARRRAVPTAMSAATRTCCSAPATSGAPSSTTASATSRSIRRRDRAPTPASADSPSSVTGS